MIDRGSYYIYIPKNCDNYTDAVIYYPGADGARGSGYDSKAIENYAKRNPNQIIIVNKSCSENTQNIFNGLHSLESSGNFKIRNINILSHSAGQQSAINTAAKGGNNGFNVKYVGVLDSAFKLDNLNVSDAEAQALARSGTTAVFFDQSDYGRTNNLGKLIKYGVPIVYVKCNTGTDDWGYNHATINSAPVENGLIGLMSGDISTMGNNGKIKSYEYWTYDYDNHGWKRISKEEAEKLMSNGDYITASLLNINNLISSSDLEKRLSFNLPNGSNTNSPNINKETYDKLADGLVSLCAKAKLEIKAFIATGEKYDELDHMLESKASELMNSFMSGPLAEKSEIPEISSEFSERLKEYEPRNIPEYDLDTLYNKQLTTETMELTANDLNRLFNKWAKDKNVKDSPLIGTGDLFIKAAAATGIDVLALVALCAKETNYGTDPSVEGNNFFGTSIINPEDSYDTKEEGIMAGAKLIKEKYMDSLGATTTKDLDNAVTDGYGKDVAGIMKDSLDYIIESDTREHILPEKEDEEDGPQENPIGNNNPNQYYNNNPTNYNGTNTPSGNNVESSNAQGNNNAGNSNNNEDEANEPKDNQQNIENQQEENNQETGQQNNSDSNVSTYNDSYQNIPDSQTQEEPNTSDITDENDIEEDNPYIDYSDTNNTYEEYPNYVAPNESTSDNFEEPIIPEGQPIYEEETVPKRKGNGLLTALGVTATVAGAAGAVAYNMKKSKENNEISEDEDELEISSDE